MTLDEARRGSVVRILSIGDATHRAQLTRLGIGEGSQVRCGSCFPMGPMVLECRRREVVLGRKLARCIHVREESA